MNQEEDEKDIEGPAALTDHFYELNDQNELVYSFPLMTKEALSGQIDLTNKKNGDLEIPELNVANKKKNSKNDSKKTSSSNFFPCPIFFLEEQSKSNSEETKKRNYEIGLEALMYQARALLYISSFQVLTELQRVYLSSCFEKVFIE